MTKFKTVIVAVAIVAFLGYCVWLSPNLFGNRIKGEMVADSLLKYDQGAGVYLASKDDNSKVFFGQSGKYSFYGTGALTLKASPKEGVTNFGSGFNLLIEGGNLELKAGQADILTGSVSPNGQFLALMNINGILSIYEISSGKKTYETTKSHYLRSPLTPGIVSIPFFFWSNQGLIIFNTKYVDLYTEKKSYEPTDWVYTRRDYKKISNEPDSTMETIEPTTGNVNLIDMYQSNIEISHLIGSIDPDNLLLLAITKDNQPLQYCSLNLQTSSVTKIMEYKSGIIGYHNNNLYFVKDNVLVYSKITAKSASAPVAVKLPELDGEQLTPELIENLRVTSKGYLHFRHIKTAKTYLLDPISGVYVEIPKERYPY